MQEKIKDILEYLDTVLHPVISPEHWNIYSELYDMISVLSSAQSERKKGKWVGYDGDWLKTMCKCSECGAMIDINEKYRNFFCYHCGAKMER